LTEACHLERR